MSLSSRLRHKYIVSSDNEQREELTAIVIAGSSSVPRASLEIYGRARENIDLYDQIINDDQKRIISSRVSRRENLDCDASRERA